ncbi:MAG: ribbon-helix-helix protein, CopG family [Acidobacteriaceae bacterium]
MPKAAANISVSFRAPQHQIRKLDAIARRQSRDRTQLIGEAIDQYLALQEFQLARIDEGIAAADRGDFASDRQVQAEFDLWRKK